MRVVSRTTVLVPLYCTELVGSNEFKTVLVTQYKCVLNLDEYDKMGQEYLQTNDYEAKDDY